MELAWPRLVGMKFEVVPAGNDHRMTALHSPF